MSLKKSFLICFIACLFLACDNNQKPVADSRTNDYAMYDHKGDFHRLSYYNDQKAIVLWVQGNGCPIVRNALTDFKEVVDTYKEKEVVFFMLNSNIQDDRGKIANEAETFNFEVPVLVDSAQLIADALDITITAEAIVLHPVTREVLFRGPINDRLDYEAKKDNVENHYLVDALDEILSGSLPKKKIQLAKGCKVTRLRSLEKNDTLTYTKDIAPLLEQNCVRCHRDGGIAPWAMTDYNTVAGWSAMMKEVLLSKRMPPWKADPEVGAFTNSFAMGDSSARKIVSWIDAGIPYGSGKDPLMAVSFENGVWESGMPDLVMTLDKEKIPASELIPYRYQELDLKLEEDKWLRGVDMMPGNPAVVHHFVLTNRDTNEQTTIINRKARPWTDNYIAIGNGTEEAIFFPENSGVFLRKGTQLTMQIHYTGTGKPETDVTKVGLYFHDSIPKKEYRALSPTNVRFKIPPYAKKFPLTVSDTITKAITIHSVSPHMHYRGKSIKIFAVLPGGTEHLLISVGDYNFNWQWFYILKEPFSVPAGTIIRVDGIFDNSYQNPINPDPTVPLGFGLQSRDEMLIGFLNYTLDD
jgi:hypothetical protein